MRFVVLAFVALTLGGCATSTRHIDESIAQLGSSVPRQKNLNVPFVAQTENFCGPAAVSMGIRYRGGSLGLDQISPLVYTPGAEGSFPTDLISATRRLGYLAIPIKGYQQLFREVAAGNPVIVFENLALSWNPQWHYAVATGYDLDQSQLLFHSGSEAYKPELLKVFDHSWKLGEYWGLLILNPDQYSATASELEHATAASGLEAAGKTVEARMAYASTLKKWKENLVAHVGLANLAFNEKKFAESVKHLKEAVKFHPTSATAWHNLANAEMAANKKSDAKKSAKKAIELASDRQKPDFEKSLAPILK